MAPHICRNDPATGYNWRDVHADLEAGVYAGCYGWDHAAYWGIAEAKAGVDLKEWYKTRTEAEFYLPEFKELIDDPATHKDWDRISTFDPLGMTAHPPTIAACKAKLDIPELKETGHGLRVLPKYIERWIGFLFRLVDVYRSR